MSLIEYVRCPGFKINTFKISHLDKLWTNIKINFNNTYYEQCTNY